MLSCPHWLSVSPCLTFNTGTTISWWHNVPLSAGGGYYYYYIEIPKLTRPKYEVTTVNATSSSCAGVACFSTAFGNMQDVLV